MSKERNPIKTLQVITLVVLVLAIAAAVIITIKKAQDEKALAVTTPLTPAV